MYKTDNPKANALLERPEVKRFLDLKPELVWDYIEEDDGCESIDLRFDGHHIITTNGVFASIIMLNILFFKDDTPTTYIYSIMDKGSEKIVTNESTNIENVWVQIKESLELWK